MQLQLITLGGVKVDEEIYSVVVPTVEGEISIYPSHMPLITVAVPGMLIVRKNRQDTDDDLEYFATSGGVVEVSGKRVKILVDEADHGEDIVEAESQAALERAIKMRDEAKDQIELEKAHQLVDRHMVRIKVADLHRRRRRC